VIGSRDGSIREALRALANKSVDVVSLITRRMRLELGVEAMAYAARPDVLKVILKMD
jgi:hypothetical protein